MVLSPETITITDGVNFSVDGGGVKFATNGKGGKKGGEKPPEGPKGRNQVPGKPVQIQKDSRRNPSGGGRSR